jgi:hypothetical protein
MRLSRARYREEKPMTWDPVPESPMWWYRSGGHRVLILFWVIPFVLAAPLLTWIALGLVAALLGA